ncbi:vWA domain-containing protein [Paenibacillus sp.]|uniref:vWA domain-containing protein n=1 Tax=Paenibacillus sp. TaxID=58172 RepID=UPI002D5490EE|nr:von Willebrand factor type A domain-containing protein [Paenibacillus sp.]HZG84584.1 von Willebrand factor type A domain-containing protein [Paenibacillus sp.]
MKGKPLAAAGLAAAIACSALAGCSGSSGTNAQESTGVDSAPAARNEAAERPAKKSEAAGSTAAADVASSEPAPPAYGKSMPAPPNGEAYDDMYFDHAGTNPFIATEEDPLSTFAVDVDTGSYAIVRNYIEGGALPPEDAVRVEEFVNYFEPGYPAPKDQTFAIHADGGSSPFGEGYELLRIGIKGKEIEAADRPPANLTFVIDVSGSMDRDNRLGLVKQSLHLLVDSLEPSDQVAIVTYGSDARVALEPTSLEDKSAIEAAIDALAPSGSTNAEEGLSLGYQVAERQWSRDAINRVILCSDGVANVGETSAEGILDTIREYAGDQNITLTTVGFGMGNYNDTLMEQLANQGDGVYAYVDSFTEARRLFVENLAGTLQTIATEAKIQVEFDPEAVERYRLLGYENRDLRDEQFRDDGADAGEVGAGHAVTALYEVKLTGDDARDRLGTARLRYVDADTNRVEEWSAPLRTSGELSDELRFLAAVAEYAELLRGSYWAKDGSMDDVLELAEASARDERELQFVTMVKDTLALMR